MAKSNRVSVDGFSKAILRELSDYGDKTIVEVKRAVDKVTRETIAKIKDNAPQKTNKYKDGWKSKGGDAKESEINRVIHNDKRYQIAHLLEKGHARRGGGRSVGAIVHIAPAEEKIEERLIEELRKNL